MDRVSKTIACLIGLLALSCSNASYSKVESEKVSPQFNGGPGSKMLVVVASLDPGTRETVETQFAIEGVERKINLTPSHRLVKDLKELTRERLIDLVRTESFDRVLIVRAVPGSGSSGKHTDYRDHYSVIGSMSGLYPAATGLYGDWGSTVVVTYSPTDPPPSFGTYQRLSLETLFYNSTDEALVWNSLTQVTQSQRQGEAAEAFAKSVLGALKGKNLM